ncbi:MAG: DUF2020 domain-containing protein, partial [Sciscionella sp.]|nr:DUF2020 domain-containing protein [Sciscionella sp.]
MAAALSGCGPHSATAPSTTTTTVTTTKPAAIAPPAPTPAASADCPYLDRGTAGDDNGQRVYQVKISKRVGSNPPACFFYRADGSLQLSVWVYVGSPDVAHAIVDK